MYSDFFITCSGADKDILKDCPTERTKFIGIGATIFLTAVLAGISGGYAIYFTFNNFLVSFFFGLLWGFIIFNLDRYIVSSIKKTGNFLNELWTAFPRFLIAIVLAITISKPLEIKLFDGSITSEMGNINKGRVTKCEDNFNAEVAALTARKSELETELPRKKDELFNDDPRIKDVNQQIEVLKTKNVELNNTMKSNYSIIINNKISDARRIPDPNDPEKTIYIPEKYTPLGDRKIKENKALDAQYWVNQKKVDNELIPKRENEIKPELASLVTNLQSQYSQQIAGIQTQINDKNNSRATIIATCQANANLDEDILSRLRALSSLKQDPEKGSTVMWASLLITLLFMLLETAPITVKLLAKRGPYDEIFDRVEYEIFLQQQKIISDKNDEINNLLIEIKEMNKLKGEVRMKTERAKLDAELKANETLLTDIAKKQGDLAKIAVDKWYDEELNKLKENPMQQYTKNKQLPTPLPAPTPQVAIFEDVKWKAMNLADEVFYIFKNGKPTNNELEYEENGIKQAGTWKYLTPNKEIKIDLHNISETYILEDLTSNSVKLKTNSNDFIELTKV